MLRTMIVLILLISAFMTKSGWGDEKLPYEVKISVYPREVPLGDTCYVLAEVTNNSDFPVLVNVPEFYRAIQGRLVQFSLSREGKTWYGTFECEMTLSTAHVPPNTYHVESGETIVTLILSLQFPSLDELHTPFWQETLNELQDQPEGLMFDFLVKFSEPFWDYPLLFDDNFRKKMDVFSLVTSPVRES